MRSETELGQFLRIFLPTFVNIKSKVWLSAYCFEARSNDC